MITWDEKYQAKRQELVAKYGEDFAEPAETFTVNRSEQAAIDAWYQTLIPMINRLSKVEDPLEQDAPYYGAVGGGLVYSFTPTSLGTILVVTESITKQSLNVTAALDWHFYG